MPAGRPLKFKTPQALQKVVDEYFKTTKSVEWTITGLALAIDTSREGLINYAKRDDYSNIVRRAKLKVENSYELSLRKNGRAGDIFGLKNFGWKDKKDLGLSTERDFTITLNRQTITGKKES